MKIVKGLASLLVLLVLVVGIPAALVMIVGNPMPSIETLQHLFTTPDYGGAFLFGNFLPIVAWIAWATFAVSVLVEAPSVLGGISVPKIKGLGAQQALAGALIGAVLLMFTAGSLATAAPAQASTPLPNLNPTQATAPLTPHTTTAPESANTLRSASAKMATPAESSAPKHTVQAGESLWQLAQTYLGDGAKYTQIAQLNYGVQQSDGAALSDDHWIEPGWVLTLPAGANTTTAAATIHTVIEGETLASIAGQYYGDTNAFTGIFQASQHTVQADGDQLTNPDLIRPGWTLTIPATTPPAATKTAATNTTPAPPTTTPTTPTPVPTATAPVTKAPTAATPGPVAPAAPAVQAPTQAPAPAVPAPEKETFIPGATISKTPTPDTTAAETAAPYVGQNSAENTAAGSGEVETAETESATAIPTRTIGGIGSILAAGVLAVLGLRRINQRRGRKAGERTPAPVREDENLELQLRAVEEPSTIEDLDHALKYLAIWGQDHNTALPQMFCVRVATDEIALYLAAPAELPDPFTPVDDSNTVWTVDPAKLEELDRVPTAPYPALVTVGQDSHDAHLLIDLEYVGALGIAGEQHLVANALTALAVELATSKWGEQLQITMVGIPEDLPAALAGGKVRHVDDMNELLVLLRGKAKATQDAFTRLGVTGVEEARTLGRDAEGWMPEILILGEQPAPEQRAELEALVTAIPRLGIAAVSAGKIAGDWEIRLNSKDSATLAPLGLDMTPQLITDDEAGKIMNLLNTASQECEPGPDWTAGSTPEDIALDEVPVTGQAKEEPPALYAVTNTPGVADEPAEVPETAELESETNDEPVPAELETIIENIDHTSSESAPIITVLGTVSIINPRGQAPRAPGSGAVSAAATARCTALAAFLALNPGASAEQYHEAFWPTQDPQGQTASSNRNKLSNLTRNYLGQSTPEGEVYFPHVVADGYRLHADIKTDWHVFGQLIGEDLARTSTPRLIAALRLVRGQPFSGTKDKLYGWTEIIQNEMIAAICDAAHELARRSLKTGDNIHARLAGAVGRIVDPANEQMWRDSMLAEHAAGNSPGVEDIVTKYLGYLHDFDDDYEPDEETQDLIDQLRRHGHPIAS